MENIIEKILATTLPLETPKSKPTTTPRFLFRVWSPNSDGKNSARGFDALGRVTNRGRPRKLAELKPEDVKQMITHHVAWTSKWAYHDDILISFTSSLLFAVQHAIRKMNTSPPGCLPDTPETCFLTIIDNSLLKQTFHKTTSLVDEYAISDTDWADRQIVFQRPQHEHEYLAEWNVDLRVASNCSFTVAFGVLMRKGIDKVIPQFDVDYQKQLGMHVSLIRFLKHVRDKRYVVAATISFEELTAICNLTACFSGKWQQLMRVWFMAMSKRKVDDQAVRDMLNRSWNATDNIFHGYDQYLESDLDVVIEEREFTKLMTLGAALAHQRESPDNLLPEWAPKPNIALTRSKGSESEDPVSFVDFVSPTVTVEAHTEAKAVKANYNSIEEMLKNLE